MSVRTHAIARLSDDSRRTRDRSRRLLRPTLLALEDRRLLSTFSVTSTFDDGSDDTLRWAVAQANSNAGADTIAFDGAAFGSPLTITLGGTQLELSDTTGPTTIAGSQAGVTVSGGGASRVFQNDEGASASLTDLTISGGQADADGGGILNRGTTELIRCTVSGNTEGLGFGATDPGRGGGIHNSGTLSVTNSTIVNNQARYAYFFDNSTSYYSYVPGSGGGSFSSGAVTVAGSTITGNSSGYGGGAGIDYSGGTATLTDTIVAGNAGNDLSGPVPGTYNLIGSDDSSWLVDGVDGNLVGVSDPGLGALGNYGGPTQTIPLLPGSPAINAGTTAGRRRPTSVAWAGSAPSTSAPSRARGSPSRPSPAAPRNRRPSARRSPTHSRSP
ncbi:choice-of-anchor Q domain-containing protein [Tautonia plasticadhaerens]|uniref:Right handed beta helix domain-containing protein n=1 Tax=Tautonia plasticadhaerens TaxID=2527974 RepID=A0A518H9Z4_9BACT|nr:choice-of-anchor Q domain-containing protein [Tautonia plasticadhaerens]QDV37671.1 hypothetical protein ElP_56140 [Tautonia plasticadhaerens]